MNEIKQNIQFYLIALLLLVIIMQNGGLIPSINQNNTNSEIISKIEGVKCSLDLIRNIEIQDEIKNLVSSVELLKNSVDELSYSEKKPVPVSIMNVDKYALKWLQYSQDDAVPVRIKNSEINNRASSDPIDVRVLR